ncbi:Transcription elongation factor SPT6 [Bulinus truncatus]|nr:Transcription elongation factor SPT6 [Bulinus truncatus]
MDFMENEAEESNPSSAEEELSDGELRPQIKKEKERKKCTIQISDDEEEDEEEDPEAIAEEMKDFINEDVEEEEDTADVSKEDKKNRKGDSDEDDQLDDVDYDLIDDNLEIKVNRKSSSNACHSLKEVFEPSELERGHFTDAYNAIRLADFPDGFQLRRIPVKEADDAELEEEADWIYKQAFATLCISQQTFLDNDHLGAANNFNRRTPNAMTSKIKQALGFMRNHRQEVPFIAFYRKEYVEPELNFNDLWKVYHWDEKWMQLCTRRSNLTRLFEKMKEHLYKRYSDPDKPVVLFRPITDEEIERVKNVQTPEELRDVYQNFLFYYGHEIPNMRNSEQSRPREEGEADSEPKPKGSSMKQAQRQSGYSVCLAAKLMPNSRNMYSLSSNLSDIGKVTNELQRMKADFYHLYLKKTPGTCSKHLKLLECTKCPKHSGYISLESLNVECLPTGYHYVDLMYLIKSLFELTVMVEVESKSSMDKEDNFFWQGSGKVEKIDLFNGTPCKCTLCITSNSPSHIWGEITIATSTTLTSFFSEANRCSSYFFYDNYYDLDNVKCLVANRVTRRNTMIKTSKFVCITCDLTLLRRLDAAIKQFDEAYNKCVTIPEENDKLVMVVAHPHACIKHVTFSRCPIVDNIYNEIPCPGLSGAYILSLKGPNDFETYYKSEKNKAVTSFGSFGGVVYFKNLYFQI